MLQVGPYALFSISRLAGPYLCEALTHTDVLHARFVAFLTVAHSHLLVSLVSYRPEYVFLQQIKNLCYLVLSSS